MQHRPRPRSILASPLVRTTALFVALGSAAACPAAAQYYGYNTPGPPAGFAAPGPVFRGDARPLPADDIVERLEDRGFEDVSRPRFDGSHYTLDATNPRGLRVRLVIDAFHGRVVDRVTLGRGPSDRDDDDEPLVGPRPGAPREWFGNNVPPPGFAPPSAPRSDNGVPRSARIDPPGVVETAPLGEPPRSGTSLPAPRDLAPQAQPDRAASLPRPSAPSPNAVDGGNPDLIKGEQRKPVATNPNAAPHIVNKPRPASPATPAGAAAATGEPLRPAASAAQPASAAASPSTAPKPEGSRPDAPKIEASKTEAAKAEGLSPIRPLKPQVAPDVATLNAEAARGPDKPVRVIGGVTPVPAPAAGGAPATGGGKGGPITADSNDVKP